MVYCKNIHSATTCEAHHFASNLHTNKFNYQHLGIKLSFLIQSIKTYLSIIIFNKIVKFNIVFKLTKTKRVI